MIDCCFGSVIITYLLKNIHEIALKFLVLKVVTSARNHAWWFNCFLGSCVKCIRMFWIKGKSFRSLKCIKLLTLADIISIRNDFFEEMVLNIILQENVWIGPLIDFLEHWLNVLQFDINCLVTKTILTFVGELVESKIENVLLGNRRRTKATKTTLRTS